MKHAARGVGWRFVAYGASRLFGFGANLVLARLLSPSEFGLVSYAMVFISALTLLQDLGMPAALIYRKGDSRDVAGTALTINVGVALVLLAIAALTFGPILTWTGADPEIGLVATVLSFGIVVSAIGSVQNALLMRELAFRQKLLPDVAPFIVSGILSICCAFAGLGVWSLVIGYLTRTTTTTLLLWLVSNLRSRPSFRFKAARELLGYGWHASLATLIGFTAANIDYVVVGALLGTRELGIYTVAFNIATLPAGMLSQVISTVTFPALSRLHDQPRAFFTTLSTMFHSSLTVAAVAGLGLYVCAPAYVGPILSDAWLPAVVPLQLLAMYGVFRSITAYTAPAFKALGRPDVEWKISLVRIAIHFPLMVGLTSFGVNGVAISHVIVAFVFVVVNLVVLGRLLNVGIPGVSRLVWPHLVAGICCAILLYVLTTIRGMPGDSWSLVVPLLISALLGSLYLAIILLVDQPLRCKARTILHLMSCSISRKVLVHQ